MVSAVGESFEYVGSVTVDGTQSGHTRFGDCFDPNKASIGGDRPVRVLPGLDIDPDVAHSSRRPPFREVPDGNDPAVSLTSVRDLPTHHRPPFVLCP